MPEPLPPESHYNPKKLDKIFAIASIVLLLGVVGLFAKDYSRQWKDYQRQFRALEVEKTRVKLDEQEKTLTDNTDYQDILKKAKEAQKAVEAFKPQIEGLNQQLKSALAVQRLHTQQFQFAKAQYDALKYKYESSSDHNALNAAQLKLDLEKLGAKVLKLHTDVEKDKQVEKDISGKISAKQSDLKTIEKQRFAIAKKKEILEKKLKRIDIAEMSAANQLAEMVRDLPIIDLANPNYKIKQIVLKDIPEDVNFLKVPRVDRCTTCHLGIDNPDFKDAAQPFRTHPNLELFLDKNSSHPIEEFACTSCHGGRGRATDFTSAAHTPKDEEEALMWKQKYGWKELEHWEHPILPVQFTQAGCFKCHQDQGSLKGAEKLNLGMSLIEKSGCYGCHNIPKYNNWPKVGPNLDFLAQKTSKDWVYQWISNPKSIRHNAWMPSYFNQSNNNDPKSIERSHQEVNAIVEYLFANSKPYDVGAMPVAGDAVKGKELVASIGCLACHQVLPEKKDIVRTTKSLHQEFGPNLIGLASKTSKAWVYQWLKDPSRYHSQTRMPSLRLSDQEAADITEYLTSVNLSKEIKAKPEVNQAVLDEIAMDFLKKSDSVADAQAKLKSMDVSAKLQFTGQKLIREYGCAGCHTINGFDNEKPIGADLAEEGSKSIERFDFAFSKIEHSKHAWFKQKLANPRIFDRGRVLAPLERSRMPNFNFTDDETEAITTVLLGLVKDRPNLSKMANVSTKAAFVTKGQQTIRQLNCQACHIIEGEGGVIQPTVTDWLTTYLNKDANDAKAITLSYSPPNLIGEGAKIQAQWLFEFLHDPTVSIRPWLKVRMPTYSFHGGQINSVVKYFNYLDDQEFPFTDIYHPDLSKEEFAAAQKLFSKEVFNCAQCHIIGNKFPEGSPEGWAPNLALATKRLKPDWIIKWIKNPPSLLPSTKMPTFFDPATYADSGPPDILNGDEDRQIKALRDYVLSFGSTTDASTAKEVAPQPAQEEAPKK